MPISKLNFSAFFVNFNSYLNSIYVQMIQMKSGDDLGIRLLDNQLVDTFCRKSTARHKIYQLRESSKTGINLI
jgi:hypothetical protein